MATKKKASNSVSKKKDTKVITELTEEQKAKMPEYVERWTKIGRQTCRLNQEEAEKVIDALYTAAGYETPPIRWFESPAAMVSYLKLAHPDFTDYNLFWGNGNASIGAFYEFFRDELDVHPDNIDNLIDSAKKLHWTIFADECCFTCHNPTILEFDDQNRLHSTVGPCVKYNKQLVEHNGESKEVEFKTYSVHGITVPERIIEDPRSITVQEIEKETNAEVRRIMIDMYKAYPGDKRENGEPRDPGEGAAEYIKDCGAKVLDEDPRFGKLLQKVLPGEPEPLTFIHVKNSTQEPDGTYKWYTIRVNPNAYGKCDTVLKGVASTYRDINDRTKMMFEKPEDYLKTLRKET